MVSGTIKLRELGDLLRELESAKLEGFLPGLSFLDTSRGVNPIVEKLPYGLQEKWMTQGSLYKMQNLVQFPPFSFFTDFVCREAYIRNDPSFALNTTDIHATKPVNPAKNYLHSQRQVSSHKTIITSTPATKSIEVSCSRSEMDKQYPIHRKPHPLGRCRTFRAKTLEERKTFLKDSGICFKCCSSTDHVAKDCSIVPLCKE